MPDRYGKVLNWASHIEPATLAQAHRTATLPFVVEPLALMPDAHVGIGATVGSVIATEGAVIPAAVGVDIGCFTGDTRFALASGGSASFAETCGSDVLVYAMNESGHVRAAWATVRRTRQNAELVCVTLDTGESVRCTPDHEFMKRDMTYTRADALQPGDSLMPLYRKRESEDDYEQVMQPTTDRWQRVHWVIGRSGVLGDVPSFDGQKTIIHHIDMDKTNNSPENLQFMGDVDHSRHHRELGGSWVENVWNNPEMRARRLAGIRASKEKFYAQRARVGGENWRAYMETDEFAAMTADAGKRGAPHLVAYNTSEQGRARSVEIANRVHKCPECSRSVKSYLGLYSHRKHKHGVANHSVVSVEALTEHEDVYCLTVPGYGNFALDVGVFVHNCGMIATETSLMSGDLPDTLAQIHDALVDAIPAGVGRGHETNGYDPFKVIDRPLASDLTAKQHGVACAQFGTLGSGNHFVEICLDERDVVWVVLHSGSRGIGNQLAQQHIKRAKTEMVDAEIKLEDKDLAFLSSGTPSFDTYIADLLWAQEYARLNRTIMMRAALGVLQRAIPKTRVVQTINCHHNFTQRETHNERDLWVTRKGAIQAREGQLGIIPGSMGTATYIVAGRGSADSWESCSHGAGRRLSRSQAKATLSVESLRSAMEGKVWNQADATSLLDEHPLAYKDIDQVMADQEDLVETRHVLRQVLNYKGW
jgi:tRNA-splicing ligase RtcB